jgi:hypothetical protein
MANAKFGRIDAARTENNCGNFGRVDKQFGGANMPTLFVENCHILITV